MSKVRVDEVADRAGTGPVKQLSTVPVSAESVDASGANGFVLATVRFVKTLLGLTGTGVLSSVMKTFLAASTVKGMHEALNTKTGTKVTSTTPVLDLNAQNHFVLEPAGTTLNPGLSNASYCLGRIYTLVILQPSGKSAVSLITSVAGVVWDTTTIATIPSNPVNLSYTGLFTVTSDDTVNYALVQVGDFTVKTY